MLDIQAEEVCESSQKLVDSLVSATLARVALPVNEVIMELVKTLWQTSLSLAPTAK